MNTYLLDTNVALWMFLNYKNIKDEFNKRFDIENDNFIFHQVSAWEIQIKYQIGKLELPEKPESFLPGIIEESGLIYRKIEDEGIFFLNKLQDFHKDPFDHLLISHATTNGWTVITSDIAFLDYPVMVEILQVH